jgi:hypothetical protein
VKATHKNDTDYLSDGRVLKGVHRIESIRTRYGKRIEISIRTRQCSRMIRLDFNTLTAKMYIVSRNVQTRRKISAMILKLELIAEGMNNLANFYPKQIQVNETTSIKLRIVSPESKKLIESIVKMDTVLGIVGSDKNVDGLAEILDEFFDCFEKLKRFVF